jgi:hypothetical protein
MTTEKSEKETISFNYLKLALLTLSCSLGGLCAGFHGGLSAIVTLYLDASFIDVTIA